MIVHCVNCACSQFFGFGVWPPHWVAKRLFPWLRGAFVQQALRLSSSGVTSLADVFAPLPCAPLRLAQALAHLSAIAGAARWERSNL